MTQTSESGIKSGNSRDRRANGDGPQTAGDDRPALGAERERLGFTVAETDSVHDSLQRSPGSDALQSGARRDRLRLAQIADAATAFLFAGLAPALVMAALWHTTKIAPFVFVFTFIIALAHAAFLGLPLFLVFRSIRWINIMTCVIAGFAVGALPDGVLTWPMRDPELYARTSVNGMPAIVHGVVTAAGWISYLQPLVYFGLLGALAGFVFWIVLRAFGSVGKTVAAVDRSRVS